MSLAQLAVGLAGLALTVALYCVTVMRDNAKEARKDARELEHRFTELETKMGIFWRVIEEGAVTLLHRDDTPKIDVLLDKAAENALTKEDAYDLIEKLKGIERDQTRPRGEVTAALLYRAILTARFDG